MSSTNPSQPQYDPYAVKHLRMKIHDHYMFAAFALVIVCIVVLVLVFIVGFAAYSRGYQLGHRARDVQLENTLERVFEQRDKLNQDNIELREHIKEREPD